MLVETDNLLTVQSAANAVGKTRQNLQQRIAGKTIEFVKIDGKDFIDTAALATEYPDTFTDPRKQKK